MKLTDRDIEIINFISENTGATIEQLQEIYFPSYNMAAKRLKILADNKYLRDTIHPVLGKKVYYIKKVPSYHALVITEISMLLKDKIAYMKREYQIKKYFVDCIFVLKSGHIISVEIDIFNKTKEEKLLTTYEELRKTKANVIVLVVSKNKRKEGRKEKNNKYIVSVDIKNLREVLKKIQ